ncbi:hypothetical protein COCVIDRAFT_21483, partial [Bipolaris victoriae FI3]
MHSSTIAVILAFTAGMAVNGAPLNPSVGINPSSRLLTIDDLQYKPEQGDAIHQLVDKRDPQRSRGHKIGNVIEGISGAIGGAADLLTIGGAVQGQPQKRDPQRSKGRIIGNIGEGIAGGVGAVADLLTIGGAVQGQNQKRDPQRSRGRLIGNIGEGIGEVIGGAADLITIGGAVQGQPQNQKRDPQRSKGRIIGNIGEGIGGAIGAAADFLTIGGAVQGQNQKRGLTVVDDLGQPVVVSEPADYDLAEGQNEKRDPQRSKGRIIGNIAEGVAGGVGAVADFLTIGGAAQGQNQKRGLTVVDEHGQPVVARESADYDYDLPEGQNEKRDPQRGRRIGNFIKGFGEGVGIVGDLGVIGGALQGQNQKRGLTVVDDLGQPIVASESADDDLPEVQNEKRDPQRGRRIGNFFKGFGEGIGIAGDLLTLAPQDSQPAAKRDLSLVADDKVNSIDAEHSTVGLLAPAIEYEKRDPQRNRGHNIGKAIEGLGDGLGALADVISIGGAVQGQQPPQKREPQRNRGHSIGRVIEGLGDGLGAFADIVQIGGAVQGQQPPQKREPQRSKGRIIGNVLEGVGG